MQRDQTILATENSGAGFFQPVSGVISPRYAGARTFMRLPRALPNSERFLEVQIGMVGVPWDGGKTNRPNTRHGPRQPQ